MRIVVTLIVGIIIGWIAQPQHTVHTIEQHYETIVTTVPAKAVDVQQLLRRIDIDPPETDEANAECAYALQRQTDEPLEAIIYYVERRYDGDACAAYMHQVAHGYY